MIKENTIAMSICEKKQWLKRLPMYPVVLRVKIFLWKRTGENNYLSKVYFKAVDCLPDGMEIGESCRCIHHASSFQEVSTKAYIKSVNSFNIYFWGKICI